MYRFLLWHLYLLVLAMFACLSKLAIEPLLDSLNVALLTGEVVVSSKVASECPLVLCGHVLEVDLVVFNLLGFDIVLSMDWLSQHYACINYFSQKVSF